MPLDFASLHTHSDGSLLDGFALIDEYFKQAKKLGLGGIGLTDHGNEFRLYEFLQKAKDYDIPAVPGMEAYVAPLNPLGSKVQKPVYYGKNGKAQNDVSGNGAYLHMTMFAINNSGLENLFELSTKSFQPENVYVKPRIDLDMMEELSDGIVVTSGCPSGEICTRFSLGQDDKAYEYAGKLLEIYGRDRFFIEVMNHNMSIDIERKNLGKLRTMAKKMNLEFLATNDTHYAHKEDAVHHEELLCSQSNAYMSDPTYDEGGRRFAFNGREYYLKTGDEMQLLLPQEDFPNAVSNSMKIIEMAEDVSMEFNPHLRPNPKVPEGFTQRSYMLHLIKEGYKEKYYNETPEIQQEAQSRIQHEFRVIESSDFIGYFLTVYDYLTFAKDNFSVVFNGETIASSIGPGRGSVGGSVIAYCMGISDIEPIKYDLLFERFLSEGRGATYQITYDDGTTEIVPVSDVKKVHRNNGKVLSKYIHQLKTGDEVE